MSEPDNFQKPFPDRQPRHIPDWSQFKTYSVGIVAEDKAEEYEYGVWVVPLEITPNYDGEIRHAEQDEEIEGFDRYKENYTVTITKSTAIWAEWLPLFSGQRRTPPNLKRGERVLLWRYAEEDRFYWTTMGMDEILRRLEHVTWSLSAEVDEEIPLEFDKNLYYLTVSTRDKYIKFRSSGPNEGSGHDEPYIYTFYWSTGEGYLYFQDDADRADSKPNPNRIYFNSKERVIYALNADETQVRLDKEDLYFHCKNDLIGEVGNNATLDIGNDVTAAIGNNATAHIGKDLTANIGNDLTASVGNNIKADIANKVEAKIGGDLKASVTGALDAQIGGDAVINATASVELNAGGPLALKGNGVSLAAGAGTPASPESAEPTSPEKPSFDGPWPSGSQIVTNPKKEPFARTRGGASPQGVKPRSSTRAQSSDSDAEIKSERDLIVDIPRDIDIKAGGNVSVKSDTGVTIEAPEVTVKTDKYSVKAGESSIKSDSHTLDTAQSTITGGTHTVESSVECPACHTSTGC